MIEVTPLEINGAWVIQGRRFADDRGWFQEWFKHSDVLAATGYDFSPVQTNISKSSAGVIRGIHYSVAPAGQGKLVTVMSGAIDDYVIDVRRGSPTFGRWQKVRLSAENGNSMLLDPRLAHAFQAMTDNTVVSYLVTAEFNPEQEKAITPYCPRLAINWDDSAPHQLSEKDLAAPGLDLQETAGLLPILC